MKAKRTLAVLSLGLLISACQVADLKGPPATAVATAPKQTVVVPEVKVVIIDQGAGQTETCVPASLQLTCDFSMAKYPTHNEIWDATNYAQPEAVNGIGYAVVCTLDPLSQSSSIVSLGAYYADQTINPMLKPSEAPVILEKALCNGPQPTLSTACTESPDTITLLFTTLQSVPDHMCSN